MATTSIPATARVVAINLDGNKPRAHVQLVTAAGMVVASVDSTPELTDEETKTLAGISERVAEAMAATLVERASAAPAARGHLI